MDRDKSKLKQEDTRIHECEKISGIDALSMGSMRSIRRTKSYHCVTHTYLTQKKSPLLPARDAHLFYTDTWRCVIE